MGKSRCLVENTFLKLQAKATTLNLKYATTIMKKTSIVTNTEASMAEEGEGGGGNEHTIEMYDVNYFQQSTNLDDLVMIDLDEEEEDGDNEGIEQHQSNNVEEPYEVKSSSTSTAQSSPVSGVAGSKRSLASSFRDNESGVRMKQQQRRKNSCRWIIMGIAGTILVACGLGIGLGLIFTKEGDSNDELSNQESTATSVPTSTTQRSQLQDLVMKYSFSSLDIPSVFDNSTSPQSRAIDYLMDLQSNHPNSLLDEEEFVSTQYGLAVLYYATGGGDEDSSSSWKQSYGFLQSNDYCKWNTNNPENSRSAVNVGVRTTATPSSVVQGVLCNDNGQVTSIQLGTLRMHVVPAFIFCVIVFFSLSFFAYPSSLSFCFSEQWPNRISTTRVDGLDEIRNLGIVIQRFARYTTQLEIYF